MKQAFFFRGDSLLLPLDTDDFQADTGLPLELSKEFINPEILKIPALNSGEVINAVSISAETVLPDNWKSIPVRQLLAVSGTNLENIIRACHIVQWRKDSRFCGTCGAENKDADRQAQRICPNCGRTEFPRICPAVIVVITDNENRILLAHNKRFRSRVYSHISGFNEAGETLEETVAREVREEVNIEIKDIEYVKSQPWPFPNSLMLGFKARYLSGTVKPDGDEIEDAGWFTCENLPELPGEGSLSRMLINSWLSNSL
ncbi:MAG: NAD(+) diphosphatase [Treponema sp.]|nr:NAD(+) diphosphatase [Treponema sp.]